MLTPASFSEHVGLSSMAGGCLRDSPPISGHRFRWLFRRIEQNTLASLIRGWQETTPVEAIVNKSKQEIQVNISALCMLSRVSPAVPRLKDRSYKQDLMVSIGPRA